MRKIALFLAVNMLGCSSETEWGDSICGDGNCAMDENAANCPTDCEESSGEVCAPNQTQTCACAGGVSGVQVCAENQLGWTPCGCDSCRDDSDCDGGSRCMAGVCIQNKCYSDDDCAPDQSCIQGNCRSAVVGQYAISGRVTAENNGISLTGVRVAIEGSPVFDTTDENGRYSLPSLSEGTYTIVATMTCYRDFHAEVALFGADRTFDIALDGSGCGPSCPCGENERCENGSCVPSCICEYPNECNNGRASWMDDDECVNAVWTDPDTGMHWFQAYTGEWDNDYFCGGLSRDGIRNWHWATISDLRTLVRGCSSSEPRGSCTVTDENPVLEEWEQDGRSGLGCPGCSRLEGPTDGVYVKNIGWVTMPASEVTSSTQVEEPASVRGRYITLNFDSAMIPSPRDYAPGVVPWDGRYCVSD